MRRAVVVCAVSMLGWLLAGAGQAAAEPAALQLEARVDGQVVGDGRLLLDPGRPAEITVTVSNPAGSTEPVRVTGVRLSGTALALTLFSFDTAVAFDVPAGDTVTRTFPLDPAGLQQQVTGTLPASLQVLGPQREVLAAVDTTAEVRGSMWSVYGVFATAVLVVSALAWAGALLARRPRQPVDRWRRGLRFLPAGLGTGLSAVVWLSVLRLVAPTPVVEVLLLLGCGGAAFAIGAFAPQRQTRHAAAVAPAFAAATTAPVPNVFRPPAPAAFGPYPPAPRPVGGRHYAADPDAPDTEEYGVLAIADYPDADHRGFDDPHAETVQGARDVEDTDDSEGTGDSEDAEGHAVDHPEADAVADDAAGPQPDAARRGHRAVPRPVGGEDETARISLADDLLAVPDPARR